MNGRKRERADHEISHGKKLSQTSPEMVWGWGTPAGKVRARRRAELIIIGASLAPNRRVLEIGCGTGLFTEMFARTGVDLIAVDVSGDLLEKAKERKFLAGKVQFLQKCFEDCDIDGPFDAVIGSSVLHHLDVEVALPKIFGLLKTGGVMSFTEPNMLNPQIMLQKNIRWIGERMGDSPDERAFTRWQLRRLLQQCGFENIEIRLFDWLHPMTPESLIPLVSKMGGWLEKMPLIREFAGSLFVRARRPLPDPIRKERASVGVNLKR
jgi:2-polyprenyl-3-methyl-5-hydroxy-6-metoxy-1,4-benzoquinol methylase